MYDKILVPLDGSKTAEAVLPYVRALAEKLEVDVELIAAVDLDEMASNVSAAEGLFLDTLFDDECRRQGEYLKEIAISFPAGRARFKVEKGSPAAVIVDTAAADKQTLIAMATHGRSGLNRWLLGSVAEKVLRAASNPTLLVRASSEARLEERAPLKSVVVPLDGSDLAERVLPAVVDFAKRLDLEVILFRAYSIPYAVYGGGGYYALDLDKIIGEIDADVSRYLQEKVDALRKTGLEKVSCASKEGLSADEIIKFSRHKSTGMIAMCSHGRSGVKRWVLGSVTETVARHSTVPVLVVRAG